jgi:insulysin
MELTPFLVHHDAAHIKALTKADMIEFFKEYILPSSSARSKLAVHLNAQAVTETETKDTGVVAVVEKGLKALGLNKDKKDEEDGEVVSVKVEGNGTTPFVITDVREFKSKMQISAGPQPVKHISEFEELDSKL